MAHIEGTANIQLKVTIAITEIEARALEALAGYGDDEFIKAFYEKLGKHYMQNYEGGLRSFLQSMRTVMPSVLSQVDIARKAFHNAGKAVE